VLITIPFILPTVVVTAAFNTLLGPRGWLNLGLMSLFNLSAPPIHMLNSLSAILLAHIFYNTSIVIRMVGSNLSRLRQNLPLAAQNLGASPWRAFKEVTLPLLMPAILSATLMVFLFDFTSFGVVLMLGGPQFSTLEVEIYNQAMNRFNLPVAGLLSIVQLAFTLLVSVLINRSKQPRYGKAALASESSGLREARTRWEKIFVIVMVVVLLLLMVTPTLSLLTRSFFTFDAARGERGELKTGFTLRYYRELFENREQSLFYVPPILAIRNSMIYAGITMLLATVLGLISVYAIQKSGKLSRFLEPLITYHVAFGCQRGDAWSGLFNCLWWHSAYPGAFSGAHSCRPYLGRFAHGHPHAFACLAGNSGKSASGSEEYGRQPFARVSGS